MTRSPTRALPGLFALSLMVASTALTTPPRSAHAEDRAAPAVVSRSVGVKRIFPFLDRYYALPATSRTRFVLNYYLRQDGHAPTSLRATLAGRPLDLAPDGRVRTLPTQAQMAADAPVALEAPPGQRFGVSMEIEPTLRPAVDMDAQGLAASIDQVNAAARSAAGVLSMAIPRMTRIVMRGAQGGEAILADGRRVPLPVVSGNPVYDPAATPGARVLHFARAPSRMEIGPAPRRGR